MDEERRCSRGPSRGCRRILACTVPEAEPRLRRALAGDDLGFAFDMDSATTRLEHERFDLVLIGMLFAESRGLELLEWIRSHAPLADVPVVGLHGARVGQQLPPEVFYTPMRALGARDVIDMGALPDDAAGDAELMRRVGACVGS